jgi:outer membrane receptor protein involved in Fe transport
MLPNTPRDSRSHRAGNGIVKSVSIGLLFCGLASLHGQTAPAPATPDPTAEEDTVILSPFVVDASKDRGYQATNTLAGTRLRTDLADVGSSISVMTKDLLDDIGATNNETALSYALNTEVGGPRGNFTGGASPASSEYGEYKLFSNPNGNTRVRGLTSADNTRDFFRTDVPWDGYAVDRIDLQRGPNAILFGLGSPAGVVNASTIVAKFQNQGKVAVTFDKYGSQRYAFDYNRVLLPDELALRIALLRNDQKFQQDPAAALDQREFATLTYKPRALNKNGVTFEVSGNFEHGEIDSNRPRIFTPTDRYTAYWKPVTEGGAGQQVFNPYVTQTLPGSVQEKFAGTQMNVLINSNRPQSFVWDAVNAYGALDASGNAIPGLKQGDTGGAYPYFGTFGSLTTKTLNQFATSTGGDPLPFASFGGYRAQTLTDPSVFDFYHRLIDGPNKGESIDWNVGEAQLSNTFLNGMVGYNLAYFKQNLVQGQWSALGYDTSIYMDIDSKLPVMDPATGSLADNPDVGRPYIDIENRPWSNNKTKTNRDSWRIQAFVKYDFDKRHEGLWAKLLGSHTLTGAKTHENEESDVRARTLFGLDSASLQKLTPEPYIAGASGDNGVATTFRYYLGDDMRGLSAPGGSELSNMAEPFIAGLSGPMNLYRFNNTWTAGSSVNPGDLWANPADPTGTYTQSNNPANYQGWTTTPVNMVSLNSRQTVDGMSAEDYLTYSGNLRQFTVDSKMLVWQGSFFKNSVVGIYGWRKDTARNYSYLSGVQYGNAIDGATGPADLRPGTYNFDNPDGRIDELETQTRNWSVAAHLNKLLGRYDVLPINVSLYYNEGENFQPLAGRLDAFNDPLPPPQGKTREQSVLLATKDSKYSLRVTKYATDITNASSTGSIGDMWAFEQSLFITGDLARSVRAGNQDLSKYTAVGGDVNQLVNAIVPAWFQFEKDLKTTFPKFMNGWFAPNTSWATDSNGPVLGRSAPGFAYTEDSHSEGYEFELTANPTPNWRIAANASRTEASRTNVPGTSFKEIADFVDNAIMNTDAGLMPTWSIDAGADRTSGPYGLIFRPEWLTLNALNGQKQSEVRKWHANLITNYTFDHGLIKGLGVGGGYRWEDKGVIDYAPQVLADGSYTVNLNAPFYSPSNSTFDLWISYSRKISKDINWKIQLNVFNAFGKNELVPFRASVDYSKLTGVPLTPGMTVPMKASAFTIREGMSWQLTNTFEF